MPWLTLTTFLPLAGVVVLLAVPRIADRSARLVALGTAVATFALSVGILVGFDASEGGFQMVEEAAWVDSLNFRYVMGVDGISLFMVLLTTFLMPLAVLASWKVEHRVRAFMAAMLVLETAILGTFLALDLLLFFLFFEAILFPMYLIIGGWGYERRVYAAVKFFLYTMLGSAFLFVGILFLYFRAGTELGQATFDLRELVGLSLPAVTARWLFLAFFVAFAVKVPLFPLHTWLPDAHVEAPTAGSVILAGVLLKVGAYGLIRFNLSLFPEASTYFADAISILALIGIVYGGIVALIQTDVKRLVAYSSVSHLGFVVLGTFAFNQQAVSGGVLQMLNHGLSTGALFLLVGMVYERTHTRDLGKLGGLGRVTPVLAGTFLVVALSSLGLPGLNNFVGEFLVILGAFTANRLFGAIAAVGIVLAAIYLLWSYQRMMHGATPPEHEGHRDLSARERLVLAPIIAVIVLIGVFPRPFLDRIDPTVERSTRVVRDAGAATAAVSHGASP
ncbi:MAG: NADH-quinone oxidoreductase subunit M [Actinobacteria bacterium]|nr:NADH-quinone oxidoreductase subunit M [Actinomycetota bacterium]